MSEYPAIRRLQIAAILTALALALVAGLLLAALVTADSAAAEEVTGAVCLPGNVKYETDAGYAYSDGTATVTVSADGMTATWAPAPERTVSGVCVKLGGPGGGELVYPNPKAGTWTSATYAISHVVITTAGPNAVTVTQVAAERRRADVRWLIVGMILAAAIGLGYETYWQIKHRG